MTNGARGLGAVALLLAFGCGGDETAPPQQRSMVRERQAPAETGTNRPPVVERVRLTPSSPAASDTITAEVQATDPDDDPINLRYEWTVNGRPVGKSATLRAGAAQRGDTVEVSVTAEDATGESEPMTASTEVAAVAPVIAGISFDPPSAKVGDVVKALVDVDNEDDASLTISYRWIVNGTAVGEKSDHLPTEGMKRGDRIEVEVMASDGEQASEAVRSYELVIGNAPPKIAGIPTAVKDGDAFKYQFEASDPDGDRSLRYSLTKAPAGMTIDPIFGLATWRPTADQVGDQAIEVSVRDSNGATSTLSFSVAVSMSEPTPPGDGKAAADAKAGAAAPPAKAAPAKEAAPAKAAEPTFSDDPDPSEAEEAAEAP
jgi:hypothetical protein